MPISDIDAGGSPCPLPLPAAPIGDVGSRMAAMPIFLPIGNMIGLFGTSDEYVDGVVEAVDEEV